MISNVVVALEAVTQSEVISAWPPPPPPSRSTHSPPLPPSFHAINVQFMRHAAVAIHQSSCLFPRTCKRFFRRQAPRPPLSTSSSHLSPLPPQVLPRRVPANPLNQLRTSSPSTIETLVPVRALSSQTSPNTTLPSSFASGAALRAAACPPPASSSHLRHLSI